MNDSVQNRVRFLSNHWRDSMGWKAIPFWCVVASEGLFAARPWPYQIAMYAGGIALSWLWSRGFSPYIESRIGVMRQPTADSTKGRWKRVLLAMLPCMAVIWIVGSLLEGRPRQSPVGWSEDKLFAFLSSYLVTNAYQVIDNTNPLSRRLWNAAHMLLWAMEAAALGYWPLTYARGYFLFGMAQCVLAIADLHLLFKLAAPANGAFHAEVPHA